ncbi:MAG: ROK family protein [Actinomycetota bacterium]
MSETPSTSPGDDRSPPAPSSASGATLTLGIDVGGTKILGIAATPDGTVVTRHKIATPRVPDQVPDGILAMAQQLIDEVGRPTGIGVGVPGLVDHAGVLHYGPNVPGVLGLDIVSRLRDRFGLPAVADNDGAHAARAEHRYGAARGHAHALIVTQGTGIGGGIIVNNQVLRGANGFAGEPGHMLVDRFGHMCACGTQGCWEAVASGAGLANLARRAAEEGWGARVLELAGGVVGHIKGEHVTMALLEGDDEAATIIDRFAWWVAQGIASLINLLDCSIVVLGGGLTVISDAFITDVRRRVSDNVLGDGFRPEVPVVTAQLGEEAGAIGAALLAQDAG